MQGVFSSWRAARLYLLAWLLLGLLFAGMLAAGGAGSGASLLFVVPLVLAYAVGTGFSAYYVCRAYPLGHRHPLSIVGGIGATAACAAALWCALGAAWNSVLDALGPSGGLILNAPLLVSMFGLGVLLYGLSAAVNYLLIESERVRLLETQRLQMMLAARDAELRMLRARIDPHFLFNSLNSISALTALDPAGARAMTQQLADFFRHSLGLHADRKVALDKEMQLVRHFLAIEQVRFGARLRFEAVVDDDAGACLLPPMLLQPLVENAIKHGIGQMIAPGLIRVEARRAGSLLRIRVENDVDPEGAAAGSRGTGLGLDNVRQRLAASYGHEGGARWGVEQGRFVVELALPAQTGADDEGTKATTMEEA
ncbi:histidine kinase [Massilia sp. YIM B02763]|uniref:sensor histidine kinase n=1 Tax=Massilia sp. YIM B02763 TaxID=3050130 RepID=UPI0025B69BDE|nr:histidine kinase [Massilia sp. YIM B02763]MDN4056155.1 histidine kinase [Massilia sp. YIM B02763]